MMALKFIHALSEEENGEIYTTLTLLRACTPAGKFCAYKHAIKLIDLNTAESNNRRLLWLNISWWLVVGIIHAFILAQCSVLL